MNLFRKIVLAGFLLLPMFEVQGQSGRPVTISLFNESTSMPFTKIWSQPVHPGVQVGTEFNSNSDRRLRFYPGINLGYVFHRKLFQGVYINVDLGVTYNITKNVNLKAALGGGYMRTYTTGPEYTLVEGALLKRADQGNSRLMPSLTLGLGYRLRPQKTGSPEFFVLHKTWLEYPYSPGFIPLMSHTNLHLGAKLFPFKNQ
ncbi:hypothetical protein [Neolewinella persica]|uniref:hypothetical protein n=1 Tax=Neolewinella persica TaxID=70998 RepID=UPI0003A151A5|nr:hypothetical protein [Neolewinella persica]